MGDIPDHIVRTLEDYKSRLSSKWGELVRLLAVINSIEDDCGAPRTNLHDLSLAGAPLEGGDTASQAPPKVPIVRGAGGVSQIRPDEYLGQDPLVAAKKYIERVGHSVAFDEIAEAVQRGGAGVKGEWRKKLETGLIRSTADVVKIRDGIFGLVKFYSQDQLANLRKLRRSGNPGGKRGRPRKKGKVSTGREKEESGPED